MHPTLSRSPQDHTSGLSLLLLDLAPDTPLAPGPPLLAWQHLWVPPPLPASAQLCSCISGQQSAQRPSPTLWLHCPPGNVPAPAPQKSVFLPKSASRPLRVPSLETRKSGSSPPVQLSLGVCPSCPPPSLHSVYASLQSPSSRLGYVRLEAKCPVQAPTPSITKVDDAGKSLWSPSNLKGIPHYLFTADVCR